MPALLSAITPLLWHHVFTEVFGTLLSSVVLLVDFNHVNCPPRSLSIYSTQPPLHSVDSTLRTGTYHSQLFCLWNVRFKYPTLYWSYLQSPNLSALSQPYYLRNHHDLQSLIITFSPILHPTDPLPSWWSPNNFIRSTVPLHPPFSWWARKNHDHTFTLFTSYSRAG